MKTLAKRILPLLLPLFLSLGCADPPEVVVELDKSSARPGDTISAFVDSKNVLELIVTMGDSTQHTFTNNISEVTTIKHTYDSTGTYIIQATGINDEEIDTDYEEVEIE